MATMKAVRIHRFGEADVVQVEDVEQPVAGEGEILVRVRAASVNPVDYKIRRGQYPPVTAAMLPITQGRDFAGTVEALGDGVDGFRPGMAVYGMLPPERGAFAEFVAAKAAGTAPAPQGQDYAQAAAVPLAALTAWQGLFEHGGLEAGQRVLIHGGAGGVGHFAVQFARSVGATVLTGCDEVGEPPWTLIVSTTVVKAWAAVSFPIWTVETPAVPRLALDAW